MKKIKLRYLVFIAYALVILSMFAFSATLSRYVSESNVNAGFEVGDKLYFKYTRSSLYRNNKLIVGVEVDDEDGKRIETMNVAPGDNVVYHFFVSNFNPTNENEINSVDGYFHPSATGLLALPSKGSQYNVECQILYREVPVDGSTSTEPFTQITSDTRLNLPKVETKKVKYEFSVSVILDNQIMGTTSDDYFGASLSIEMFFNAVSILD